jgi:hypothetical protein
MLPWVPFHTTRPATQFWRILIKKARLFPPILNNSPIEGWSRLRLIPSKVNPLRVRSFSYACRAFEVGNFVIEASITAISSS